MDKYGHYNRYKQHQTDTDGYHPTSHGKPVLQVREIIARSTSNERRGRKLRNLYAVKAYDRRSDERRREPQTPGLSLNNKCAPY